VRGEPLHSGLNKLAEKVNSTNGRTQRAARTYVRNSRAMSYKLAA